MDNTMRKLTSMLAAAGLLTLSTAAAHADTGVTATLSGTTSGLTTTSPSNVALSAALNGTNQIATATPSTFDVVDCRGTGAGWHVTWQASQFTTGTHTLAVGSLTLASTTGACQAATTCTGTATGLASAAAIDRGTAVIVASAAANNGMGSYTLTPGQLSLAVPAGAYAGSYASTITITIASLPS